MNKPEFQQTLLLLVEGHILPKDWAEWWQAHSTAAAVHLNPGQLQRLRFSASSPASFGAVAGSQSAAQKILTEWNVPFTADARFSALAREETEAAMRAIAAKEKERSRQLQPRINAFARGFPEFAKLLKRRRNEVEEIGPPATEQQIAEVQQRFAFSLPDDLKEFARCACSLRIGDTFHFDFAGIHLLDFTHFAPALRPPSHGMLSVAELWWEADGDHLVLDVSGESPYPALYYSHESSPPGVRQVAPDFSSMLSWLNKTRKKWG